MLPNACASTYADRWHLASGFLLGALVLCTASFASSVSLRRARHAHVAHPVPELGVKPDG